MIGKGHDGAMTFSSGAAVLSSFDPLGACRIDDVSAHKHRREEKLDGSHFIFGWRRASVWRNHRDLSTYNRRAS
jgi:hypothetical protein